MPVNKSQAADTTDIQELAAQVKDRVVKLRKHGRTAFMTAQGYDVFLASVDLLASMVAVLDARVTKLEDDTKPIELGPGPGRRG